MRYTVDTDVAITMRDGTALLADVYRPDSTAPVPVVLMRTPYGKDASLSSTVLDVPRLVREGFAVVIEDVRGRHGSDGIFVPFRDEPDDGADSIAWAVRQPWSSGRIGMLGASYVGATQWLAAASNPAGLACIAPFFTASDYRDGWVYRGGAFELGFLLHWTLSLAEDAAQRHPHRSVLVGAVREAIDVQEALYRGLPSGVAELLDELAPYYRAWSEHAWPDERWHRLAPNPRPSTTAAPAFNVGGWYDIFLRGTLRNYERQRGTDGAGNQPRLVVGPWTHSIFSGRYVGRSFSIRSGLDRLPNAATGESAGLADATVAWFDRWLRPGSLRSDDGDPVQLFVTGLDEWRSFPDWPPPADEHPLFLGASSAAVTRHGGGRLDVRPPEDGEAADVVPFTPADPVPTIGGATLLAGGSLGERSGPADVRTVEDRRDVLCYTTPPLLSAQTVIGWPIAQLHVAAATADIDVVARLVDVSPDGRAEHVTDGILRASQRRPGRPEPLTPGTPEQIDVELDATAHRFREGHRIRLEIAASNFPRFDLNPEAAARGGSSLTVLHAVDRPSSLLLPVVSSA